MFNNRKIKQIRKMPDGDAIIVIWLQILCLAGNLNENGLMYFSKDIPFTDEMLATEFDRPISTIRLALATFEKFKMIEIVDDVLLVSNWEKYQSADKLGKIREQNKLRQQRFREKQKSLPESNVTNRYEITLRNGTDIDIDKDIYNNSLLEKTPNNRNLKVKKVFSNEDKEYLLANYLSKQIAKRLDVPLKDEVTLQRWSVDFEKMARLDGYDIDDIKDVLVFSQRDSFWQTVILSAGKFRKQYLTLLGKIKSAGD